MENTNINTITEKGKKFMTDILINIDDLSWDDIKELKRLSTSIEEAVNFAYRHFIKKEEFENLEA